MSDRSAAALEQSLREVLETMFFSDIIGEAACRAAGDHFRFRVEFQGEPSGELRVSLPKETASALAASFLGKEKDEVTGIEAVHVAGEFSNMVCGCFLSKHDSGTLFSLSSPALFEGDAPAPGASTNLDYELDEGFVSLSLVWAAAN